MHPLAIAGIVVALIGVGLNIYQLSFLLKTRKKMETNGLWTNNVLMIAFVLNSFGVDNPRIESYLQLSQ